MAYFHQHLQEGLPHDTVGVRNCVPPISVLQHKASPWILENLESSNPWLGGEEEEEVL